MNLACGQPRARAVTPRRLSRLSDPTAVERRQGEQPLTGAASRLDADDEQTVRASRLTHSTVGTQTLGRSVGHSRATDGSRARGETGVVTGRGGDERNGAFAVDRETNGSVFATPDPTVRRGARLV